MTFVGIGVWTFLCVLNFSNELDDPSLFNPLTSFCEFD